MEEEVKTGKYTSWVSQVDAESLESILGLIKHFGSRFAEARLRSGPFPRPPFRPPGASPEERMRHALEVMAFIQHNGRYPPSLLGSNEDPSSAALPAFTPPMRARLSCSAHADWAQDLDERSACSLLWMFGEYVCRFSSNDARNYSSPELQGDSEPARTMRAALRLMAMISRGERIACTDLDRLLAFEIARGHDNVGEDCG